MGQLKKYEFNSEQQFVTVLGDIELQHQPIYVSIELSPAILNELGEIIVPAVIYSKFCVDIYFEDSEDSSVFDAYEVFPKNPKHKIAGQ